MSRGFTFIELLFAVMILGIGMIMIAAFLTAGASQVNLTQTGFASSARAAEGAAVLRSIWDLQPASFTTNSAGSEPFWFHPRRLPSGTSFNSHAFANCLGSTFDSQTGAGWIPFYYRPQTLDGTPTNCQFIVVAVQLSPEANGAFPSLRSFWNLTPSSAPLALASQTPVRLYVENVVELERGLRYGIRFSETEAWASALVEGAFVLFEKDQVGRVFRLGEKVGDVWSLNLESDLPLLNPDGLPNNGDEALDASLRQQHAYVIGRRLRDSSQAFSSSNTYVGSSIVTQVHRCVVRG